MTKWRDDERGGVVAWKYCRYSRFVTLLSLYGGRFIDGGAGLITGLVTCIGICHPYGDFIYLDLPR